MLPLSRNTTYTTASPAKGVDLNDLQDCTIGGKHGLMEIIIPASVAEVDGTWTLVTGGGRQDSVGGNSIRYPIVLPVGSRIVSVTFHYYRVSTAPSFAVARIALATTTTTVIAPLASPGAGTGLATFPHYPNHTMLTGNKYHAEHVTGAAGDTSYAVSVTYDHP